jgi:glycosyltransferase involved in cell wall biosynthesis
MARALRIHSFFNRVYLDIDYCGEPLVKIAYITAGGGGMYCGSCIHDNTLARALIAREHEVLLIPTYTPIRTDEEDVSYHKVFYGGINVYLQQKSALFRMLPRFLDRWLSGTKLLRKVASGNIATDAKFLGEMTLSLSQGVDGKQKKELEYLVNWLAKELKPDLVVLTNLLIGSFIPQLKALHNVPVLVNLQGDDYFIDGLGDPWREKVLANLQGLAKQVDGFIVNSQFYAEKMSTYFDFPAKKAYVVPLGVDLKGFEASASRDASQPPTLGYLARICPEKGFHHAVDAFLRVRKRPGLEAMRFRFAGWLGKEHEPFFNEQMAKLKQAGADAYIEHRQVEGMEAKLDFFKGLDVFTVPTSFEEPKGLPVMEALAAGVPYVVPAIGAFPEVLERLGGGTSFPPGDDEMYDALLEMLLTDPDYARQMGLAGRSALAEFGNMEIMAGDHESVFQRMLNPGMKLEPLPPLQTSAAN